MAATPRPVAHTLYHAPPQVNLVMEYCEHGDLAAHHPLGEERVCSLLAHVLAGLKYLHEQGKTHRDVKPQNVLLCADGRAKLGDFGLARAADAATMRSNRTVAGTIGYMAPEAFGGARTAAVDIWAVGIMATELASRVAPNDVLNTPALVQARLAVVPPSYSDDFHAAAAQMLTFEAAWRPQAAALLQAAPFLVHTALLAQRYHAAQLASPTVASLNEAVAGAPWLAPVMVDGLQWVEQPGATQAHSVKLCECASAAADERAKALLVALVSAVRGNEDFDANYDVRKTVLCQCRSRELRPQPNPGGAMGAAGRQGEPPRGCRASPRSPRLTTAVPTCIANVPTPRTLPRSLAVAPQAHSRSTARRST